MSWVMGRTKTCPARERLSFPSKFFSDPDKTVDELTSRLANFFCSEYTQLLDFSELPFVLDYKAR